MCEEHHKNPDSQGNWGNWRSCLKYLELYCDEKTTFRDVTPDFVRGFKEFLNNVEKDTHKRTVRAERDGFRPLSQNSRYLTSTSSVRVLTRHTTSVPFR